MKIFIVIVFTFIHGLLLSQDTTVAWIKKIDSTAYKMFYAKKDIPKEAYKIIGMSHKNDIAEPADNWTASCLAKPHQGLNWIAKDKYNHVIISVTYGAKSVITRYFYLDKEKGKPNMNELTFDRRRLTFEQTVRLIKAKEFEFEEIDLID